jgi:TetR/AcrR family transcriptional repressor of nem operon
MGYPSGHKEQTRARIIKAAQKMWKTKGYSGASVDAVMKEAGLTRGGFYAHFKSKDDLFAEALAENKLQEGLCRLEEAGITDIEKQKKAVINWYLGTDHRDTPDDSCPLTVFTQEAPRLGHKPRKVIGQIVQRFGEWLSGEKQDGAGLAAISLMVGSISLARAVDDRELSDQILLEGKKALKEMVREKP